MRREALFRSGQQTECQEPFVQGNMAAVEDGTDAHREFLAARHTPIPSAALCLGRSRCRLYGIESTAVRAVRAIRPADRLQLRPRRLVIVVARMGQFGGKL